MSSKRTSPESSIDNQTNEDSDSFQQDDNAKRAKLTSLSDTKLQDLPMELIECILIKAVFMEVMDMTRKNSEWKEAAEPVISRLKTVCSQWTSILTTNYFRNELHRTFDAEKTIRVEIVQTFRFASRVFEALALKDELFIFGMPQQRYNYSIHVYDRNDMTQVKDIIPLQGVEVEEVAACNVSNCLYVLNTKAHNLSVLRITKTEEHQFDITTLISGLRRRYDTLSVSANGNLVLSWQKRKEQRALITVYGPDGQLQHEIRLLLDMEFWLCKVIPKSNGNFVLVSTNDKWETKLTEIDVHGSVLHRYQSSLKAWGCACQADRYGRIVIVKGINGTELLDSELNLLEYNGRPKDLDEGKFRYWNRVHYNRDTHEAVTTVDQYVVVIFRFLEE